MPLHFLLLLLFGAVCMLLGFYLIIKSVGGSESEGSLRFLGMEIKLGKVGPGVIFALFGLLIILFTTNKVGDNGQDRVEPEVEQQDVTPPATGEPEGKTAGNSGKDNAETAPVPPAAIQPQKQDPPEAKSTTAPPPAPEAVDKRMATEQQLLRRMLQSVAAGSCPDDILAPQVYAVCAQQLPQLSGAVAAAGPIQDIALVSRSNGYVIYGVRHTNGTALWRISTGPDGKLNFAGYAGPG